MIESSQTTGRNFVKMHGLGNDFVIIDGRDDGFRPNTELVRRIAHRNKGIGCDQVIVIGDAETADARMLTFNRDGSESEACGNAARCVAKLIMDKGGVNTVRIAAGDRILDCSQAPSGEIVLDMGAPDFDWRSIPLAESRDTSAIELSGIELPPGMAVNVGNPHIVYFVDDVMSVAIDRLGPAIESNPLFPERVNVSFAEVRQPGDIRLKVWERGAGQTLACGTAAAATFAAALRAGHVGEQATIELDGGALHLEAVNGENIRLIGPATRVYSGHIDFATLERLDEVE